MAAGFTALGMKEAPHWSRGVLGASRLQCEKTATPSKVQGAAPPPGVQRVPLYQKTLEAGLGGIMAFATMSPHSCPCPRTRGKPPIPTPECRGSLGSVPLSIAARSACAPPPLSRPGAGGCAPAGGTGGVPLFWKTSEGGAGGIAAQAKPDLPLKESAGHNKTLRPGASPPLAK